MPIPVQTIYSDNPGAIPAQYNLPASLDLNFASSRARVDGTGASGDFIMVLELLTSDGRIMLQARTDQEFAAGDTGVVSWAPFLRRQAQAAAVGGYGGTYIHREIDTGQAIGNASWITVNFTGGTTVITDATRFRVGVVSDDTLDVRKTGAYLIKGQAHFDPAFAGIVGLGIRSGAWGWDKAVEWEEPGGAAGEDASAVTAEIHQRLGSGDSNIRLVVRQDSGAGQTLESASIEVFYLGTFSGEPSDPDTY